MAPLNQKTLVGEVGKGGKAGTLAEIRMQKMGEGARAGGVFFRFVRALGFWCASANHLVKCALGVTSRKGKSAQNVQ